MVNRVAENRSTKVVGVRFDLAWVAVLDEAAAKAKVTVPELVKQAVKQRVVDVLGEGLDAARARDRVQGRLNYHRRNQVVNRQEDQEA